MSPIGTGNCETFRGTGEFPHFPGSGLNQGDLVGPQAVWEAPGPLPPGLYLRAGAAGLEGITRLSHGEVCPSSGAEKPPPTSPGWGSPQNAFVPALERMDWRQPDQLSASDTRDPAGQAEGKGTGGGRIDGRQSRALERPTPVPARGLWHQQPQLGTSSHCPHHASPMDAPVSPGDAHTAPWTHLRVLAPSWCQGAPGVMSGHPGTGTDLWHCLQGMVSWKSRSCSRLPRWKKPPWLAGKEAAGSWPLQFIPTLWNSRFC